MAEKQKESKHEWRSMCVRERQKRDFSALQQPTVVVTNPVLRDPITPARKTFISLNDLAP
jgi:hypothetical protein